jgi:hypothetical protein
VCLADLLELLKEICAFVERMQSASEPTLTWLIPGVDALRRHISSFTKAKRHPIAVQWATNITKWMDAKASGNEWHGGFLFTPNRSDSKDANTDTGLYPGTMVAIASMLFNPDTLKHVYLSPVECAAVEAKADAESAPEQGKALVRATKARFGAARYVVKTLATAVLLPKLEKEILDKSAAAGDHAGTHDNPVAAAAAQQLAHNFFAAVNDVDDEAPVGTESATFDDFQCLHRGDAWHQAALEGKKHGEYWSTRSHRASSLARLEVGDEALARFFLRRCNRRCRACRVCRVQLGYE